MPVEDSTKADLIAAGLEKCIHEIRRHNVMLDHDLADLYGVDVRALNQAVVRNSLRFPTDFMFQLTHEEADHLMPQPSTAGRGGRRYLPFAFTEEGVAMLSSVLRSRRAVQVNIEIMRAFVRMRRMVIDHKDLSRRLGALEAKYDGQFKMVFKAIRRLMTPRARRPKVIGFRPKSEDPSP